MSRQSEPVCTDPPKPIPGSITLDSSCSDQNSTLRIQAGDVPGEYLMCTFQRTNRLVYEGGPYELPPGLGEFPLELVSDHPDRLLPSAWRDHGGIFFPMNEREAFWIDFQNEGRYAKAIKFSTGTVNAITGALWTPELSDDPQDYLVVGHPDCDQPWLDGHHCGPGFIRQFVATPKGSGQSVEAQVTGEEKHGGIQLLVYLARKPVDDDDDSDDSEEEEEEEDHEEEEEEEEGMCDSDGEEPMCDGAGAFDDEEFISPAERRDCEPVFAESAAVIVKESLRSRASLPVPVVVAEPSVSAPPTATPVAPPPSRRVVVKPRKVKMVSRFSSFDETCNTLTLIFYRSRSPDFV